MSESQGLVDLLRECGLEPQSYSGRGMYGRRCVAVVGESQLVILSMIVSASHGSDWSDSAPELIRTAHADSMGYDVVVYWPDHEWDNTMDEAEDR